jgi:glycosyltransferase involved in cell wall biosynthesis
MYNEEENIEQAVTAALAVLARVTDRYEVIVVNDGSRDRTGAIADRLAAANAASASSIIQPICACARRCARFAPRSIRWWCGGWRQPVDLGERPHCSGTPGPFDIVNGYRITRNDPAVRRLYAFLYNRLARFLFNIPVRDVNCGFKVYRRHLLERLLPQLRSTGALINVEMLARARKLGATVTEVGVHHYPREAGRPTGGNPRVIVRAFRELLELWRELR